MSQLVPPSATSSTSSASFAACLRKIERLEKEEVERDWPSVNGRHLKLLRYYNKCLHMDARRWLREGMDARGWRTACGKLVECYREWWRQRQRQQRMTAAASVDDEHGDDSRAHFDTFIRAALSHYEEEVGWICKRYSLTFSGGSERASRRRRRSSSSLSDGKEREDVKALDSGGTGTGDTAHAKKRQLWTRVWHHHLTNMGDLARYRATYCTDSSAIVTAAWWNTARRYYISALALLPDEGKPHHQLALVELQSNRYLHALYHFFASLAVRAAYQSSKESIQMLFTAIDDVDGVSIDPWLRAYLRVHRALFTAIDVDRLDIAEPFVRLFEEHCQRMPLTAFHKYLVTSCNLLALKFHCSQPEGVCFRRELDLLIQTATVLGDPCSDYLILRWLDQEMKLSATVSPSALAISRDEAFRKWMRSVVELSSMMDPDELSIGSPPFVACWVDWLARGSLFSRVIGDGQQGHINTSKPSVTFDVATTMDAVVSWANDEHVEIDNALCRTRAHYFANKLLMTMMNQPNEDHKKPSASRLQPASRERHARQQDEVTSVNTSRLQLLSLQLDDIVAADPALQALRNRRIELLRKRNLLHQTGTITMKPMETAIVFDTNVYLNNLNDIKAVYATRSWPIIVPLAVATEISGLSKSGAHLHIASALADAQQFLNEAFATTPPTSAHTPTAILKMIRAITSRGNYISDITHTEDWTSMTASSGSIAGERSSSAKIADDIIMDACLHVKRSPPFFSTSHAPIENVVLVTGDANMRVKAVAHGVDVCNVVQLRSMLKRCGMK